MKIFSKLFFLSILILFSISCGKRLQSSGNQANAYLLADSIRQASTGNCAISINLESLYHGAIVKRAVNSGSSMSEGFGVVTTQTPNVFDLADYSAATGENIDPNDWTSISYNRKFDAFWTNGGVWNDEARNAVLKRSATYINSASVLGAFIVTAKAITNNNPTAVCGNATAYTPLFAAVDAFYNTFSSEEKTDMDSANGFQAVLNGPLTYAAIKSTIENGGGSCNTLIGNLNGQSTFGSAYLAGQARKNGAALLACTRIPRSGCSFAGLTTASLEDAKKFQAAVYEALQNNGDCRKPTDAFMINNANSFFRGLSEKDELKAAGITFKGGMKIKDVGPNDTLSQGSTTGFSGNILYAKKAYPLSSTLASVSANFVDAFPLKEGTTPYNDTTFSGGSNVNAKAVESCDTLGLAVNPVPNAGDSTRKKLTPPAEIVYALSVQGVAARTYSIINASLPDAVACNKSFRHKFQVPPSLNAKLPDLNTIAGDGNATGLTSACVYGKDQNTVNTVVGILGASTTPPNPLEGIAACPSTAKEGASTFANTGLNSITNSFPYKD